MKVQENVQLGRALAAMGLEDRVLNDGYLPTLKIDERADLVKGVITGLVENGKISEAVKYLYTQTPARGLFDDWDNFKHAVIERVRKSKQKEVTFGEDALKLIASNWKPDEVYELALVDQLHDDTTGYLLENVWKQLNEDQQKRANNFRGDRMWRKDKVKDSYAFFNAAGNQAKIDEMYEHLIKNLTEYNLELVATIARQNSSTLEQMRERMTQFVRAILGNEALHDATVGSTWRNAPKFCYELVWASNLTLSENEVRQVRELAVPYFDGRDIEKSEDHVLQLMWAKAAANEDPPTAYQLFKKMNYDGLEVLQAVQKGLQNQDRDHEHSRLRVSAIDEKHLQAVYNDLPLGLKADVARHLKDKNAMLDLSNKFYQQAGPYCGDATRHSSESQGRERSLKEAYRLWVEGGGLHDNPFVAKLREEILQEELKSGYLSTCWLEDEDKIGQSFVFHALVKDHPRTSYDLAKRGKNEGLAHQARERMTNEYPEDAMKYFIREKDPIGVELATATLAKKYDLAKDSVSPFIQKLVSEREQEDKRNRY